MRWVCDELGDGDALMGRAGPSVRHANASVRCSIALMNSSPTALRQRLVLVLRRRTLW